MINDGDVFLAKDFVLHDGFVHNTIFLIISGGTPTSPLLCVQATSQLDRYQPLYKGCNADEKHFHKSFYVPLSWNECFDKDTCLDLKLLYEITLGYVLDARGEGKLLPVGSMSPSCFHLVLQCFENVADDIAEDSMERIRQAGDKLILDF